MACLFLIFRTGPQSEVVKRRLHALALLHYTLESSSVFWQYREYMSESGAAIVLRRFISPLLPLLITASLSMSGILMFVIYLCDWF